MIQIPEVAINDTNKVYPYCVIGAPPQHIKLPISKGVISIGNNNIIREFTTIHLPTQDVTKIGNDNYIMSYCHIAHDCILHDNIILATRVTLGGHVVIYDNAYLGQCSAVHPHCRIGRNVMIGMGCPIVKDVPPFALINQGKFTKINKTGLKRAGVSDEDINGIEDVYRGKNRHSTWYEKEIEVFMENAKSVYAPEF